MMTLADFLTVLVLTRPIVAVLKDYSLGKIERGRFGDVVVELRRTRFVVVLEN